MNISGLRHERTGPAQRQFWISREL